MRETEGNQEVAFRTISRSDNRAFVVPRCSRPGREEETRKRNAVLSSPSCKLSGRMSREPFKKEFTYLTRCDAFLGARSSGGTLFYSGSQEGFDVERYNTVEGHSYSERVTLDPHTRGDFTRSSEERTKSAMGSSRGRLDNEIALEQCST